MFEKKRTMLEINKPSLIIRLPSYTHMDNFNWKTKLLSHLFEKYNSTIWKRKCGYDNLHLQWDKKISIQIIVHFWSQLKHSVRVWLNVKGQFIHSWKQDISHATVPTYLALALIEKISPFCQGRDKKGFQSITSLQAHTPLGGAPSRTRFADLSTNWHMTQD